METLTKVLTELASNRASDLHIFPGDSPFVRRGGRLERLAGVVFSEGDVKKIILGTSTPRAREILGRFRQVNYSYEIEKVGRFRFSVFFDRGKFAIAIRIIPERPPRLEDLGIPEPLKKTLSKSSGLIIVGSPSGQGKTTTIAAILDFINTHFEKNIITIENPVEIKFRDDRSAIIQRSIPLDIANFYAGLTEAYRLDPDVVMSDSINYQDALDQALFLAESGRLVIGATDGGSSMEILERLIYARPAAERDSLRGKLAAQLNVIIAQRLVPESGTDRRIAVFDIVVNTAQVKLLIKNENLNMVRTLQEQSKAAGMLPFDSHLTTLMKLGKIDREIALQVAQDPHEIAAKFGRRGV